MPGEEYAPNHHLAPIISGLIAWFRGDGRALLRTVRRMYGLPALFCATSAFASASPSSHKLAQRGCSRLQEILVLLILGRELERLMMATVVLGRLSQMAKLPAFCSTFLS